jgi:oligoribonuclease
MKVERNENRLCWIDLETTGLDPETCSVLEVACVVTDNKLNELIYYQRVLRYDGPIAGLHPVVLEMHTKNNLWNLCAASGSNLYTCDVELSAFIEEHCLGAPLCGSTISFDRAFMKTHLPRAHEKLHYRNIDVSSFKELARRSGVEFPETPKEDIAHRALADIRNSIATLKELNPWG